MPESTDRRSELFARALEGGIGKVRPEEIDAAGTSADETGANDVDADEVDAREIGADEIGADEIGADEIGADEQLGRELAMAGLLLAAGRGAQAHLGPDGATRERMRRRILDGLAEDAERADVIPISGAGRADRPRPDRTRADRRGGDRHGVERTASGGRRSAVADVHGRLLVAAAAALCLLVALSGMSLVLARDALPGDVLYGVKRSAESAELGLTFGDEPRGFKHLQFATARLDEIEALAARAGGTGSAGDAARYLTALRAFDTDAAAGSRLLIDTATSGAGSELTALRAWAEQQRQRLGDARAAMPYRAAARAEGSTALLGRVLDRVAALQLRLRCLAVASGTRDDLGLLPAEGPCVPVPGGQGRQNPQNAPTAGATQPPPGSMVFPGPAGNQPNSPLGPLDPGPGAGLPAELTPGATATGGPTTTPPPAITVPLPLPLPEITVPPILPGLIVGLKIG